MHNGIFVVMKIQDSSNRCTFEDRQPWQRITRCGEPVSCSMPTSFSPCLFGNDSFCCVAAERFAVISIIATSKALKKVLKGERRRNLEGRSLSFSLYMFMQDNAQCQNSYFLICGTTWYLLLKDFLYPNDGLWIFLVLFSLLNTQ